MNKNRLSFKGKVKLSYFNYRERKWRNLLISLATSIGFVGILISFGLGNAIVSLINNETGDGQLPAQVQISLNKDVTSTTGVLNKDDEDYIQKVVGDKNIKYFEKPFSVVMQNVQFSDSKKMDLSTKMPNYSQIVSLYNNTNIKVSSNTKKEVISGKLYNDSKEEGLTVPKTLVDDYNKQSGTSYSYKEIIGKKVTFEIAERTANGDKTAIVNTIIKRVITDDTADSNSYMSGYQLGSVLSSNNFTKVIPYYILELKNPDNTEKMLKVFKKNNRYSVMSQKQILRIIINFIKIIQVLLIVLSSQAVIVSVVMIGVIVYINIMQRSREIGVMKAVGYLNRDVKSIFIYEAIIITSFSLIISFIVSISIGTLANYIVQHMTSNIPYIFALDLKTILIMIVLSLMMGIGSAYFPVKKISKLDPVESLRYE